MRVVRPALSPLAAAVALGEDHGILTAEPRVLKDGSNLLVHLAPAPVVVRVATFTALIRGDPLPFMEREVAVVTQLAAAGAAIAPPSPLIPAGPHAIGGWTMTAWAWVDHEPGAVPDAATALAALDELHAALRDVQLDLPVLNPARADLDLAIAFAVGQGLLDRRTATTLRTRRDRLVGELLAATTDRQPLHGDAFPRNSLVTPAGVVWIDFEDCCSGPVAWDHAILIRDTGDRDVERACRARDGDAAIDAAMELRGIQASVWRVLHDARRAGRFAPDP